MSREDWMNSARTLDWDLTYVTEEEVFPEEISGTPWLTGDRWRSWEEPYKTTWADYVCGQHAKELALTSVRQTMGNRDRFERLPGEWRAALKLHGALLPLAEFAAVLGNLRAARFGRAAAWRSTSLLGALDELRHTQIPLSVMHQMVRWDPQFDWTHRLYHTDNWIAVAARHLFDEMLVGSDPIEFAVATHFVFETGFTNLQFVALSSLARAVGDPLFESMITSIQTDEARHSQVGPAVLDVLRDVDPVRAQYLVDKWFWRTWLFFSILTGFSMDYLTPVAKRGSSFKEFMKEWVLGQFDRTLRSVGLARPWYWDRFLRSVDNYHHMAYATAYTYRATLWFDVPLPGPAERDWLATKYPDSWDLFEPVWDAVTSRWRRSGPGVEWYSHGTTPVVFCDLCQLVLCGGTPQANESLSLEGRVFCSDVCAWIFHQEPSRYAPHRTIVGRILAGQQPGNMLELLSQCFGLTEEHWGHDLYRGQYSWLVDSAAATASQPGVSDTRSGGDSHAAARARRGPG